MITLDPLAAEQGAESVEIFFVADLIACQKAFICALGSSVVVAQGGFLGKIMQDRGLQPCPFLRGPVDDRRIGPLHDIGVSFSIGQHGFFQIPAIDIQHFVQLPLDDIFGWIDPQIFLRAVHIDKTDVIIAVRGGESPCPAAGLNRMQDLYLILLFNSVQILQDLFLYISHCHSSSINWLFLQYRLPVDMLHQLSYGFHVRMVREEAFLFCP